MFGRSAVSLWLRLEGASSETGRTGFVFNLPGEENAWVIRIIIEG